MNDISTYARMLEASWATLSNEMTVNGIRYKGSSDVLVAKARDISMRFEFQYKGEKVDDCGGFCAWVDPDHEMARRIDRYDLGPGQEGEICCICEITEDWYVIDQNNLLGDRFVKWSAPYVDDLTRQIRRVEDYATLTVLRNVVWSTNWTADENKKQLKKAHDAFFGSGEKYSDGWEEKLIGLAKDGGAHRKSLERIA